MAALSGRIVFPNDPGYETARMDYNTRFSKYPRVIVYCREIQDVMNAVKWARENSVPIRARSGGHSYEAFSTVNHGIVIDVSEMNGVLYEQGNATATVGAGVQLLPLYKALWEKGVTVPGGTCPSVGVAGLALGGGFGMLSRGMGLLCDSLTAIWLVNANGEAIYADWYVNPDLLWACRGGGGGNFGIATSFVFSVHPISSVAVYDISWDWPDAGRAIKAWQEWAPYADDRLTSILDLSTRRNGRITSSGEFLGDEAELQALIKPLAAAGQPVRTDVRTMPYIDAVRKFDGGPGPHPFKNTGAYVYRRLPNEAIKTLVYYMENSPNIDNSIEFQSLGGAVGRVPPDATAYFHRKAGYNMQYIARWNEADEGQANIYWVERLRRAMLRYVEGTYVNWPDVFIKDWPRAYYGANYPELVQIKSKYDPENIFLFEQSIRPG